MRDHGETLLANIVRFMTPCPALVAVSSLDWQHFEEDIQRTFTMGFGRPYGG